MQNWVFIHGAGGSAKHWQPLLQALKATSDIEAYCYEMPGHGLRSDALAIDMHAAKDDLEHYLNQNMLEKFVLVGHSLGGLLSMLYAIEHPDRIEKLILVSTAAKIFLHPSFLKQMQSGQINHEFIDEGFSGEISVQHKTWVVDDLMKTKLDSTACDFMNVSELDIQSELIKLTMPTLILSGDDDKIISPRRTRALLKRITSSEYVCIPGAGHYPQLEKISDTSMAIMHYAFERERSELCT